MSLLEVSGLHAHYGKSHILHGVDLDVDDGAIVSLLGRNGSGRSTTLKAIMGLVPPTAGAVRLAGTDLAGHRPYDICRHGIGFVPEERMVFPNLTVEENLRVAARDGGWSVDKAYALFPRLKERRQNLGSRLSGGEQQMLSIARALMCDPSLLLMDEPSEGLAPVIVDELYVALRRIVAEEGLTLLLVEQNVHRALSFAGRAVGLRNGEVVYDGPSRTLVEDEAQLDRIMGVRGE